MLSSRNEAQANEYFRDMPIKTELDTSVINSPTQNPPGYTAFRINDDTPTSMSELLGQRRRRKKRSKYDISEIQERQSREYFDSQPGHSGFYNSFEMNILASDKTLDLKPQKDRTVFTDQQMLILEAAYQKNKHPDPKRREMVAELCSLSAERVRIWYQNRRAKEKRDRIDELASLARQTYNSDSSANRKSTYNSLARINNRINRIFENDDKKDYQEEDVIKNIIQQELLEEKKGRPTEILTAAAVTTDRWSDYQEKGESTTKSTNDTEQDIVKFLLKNDQPSKHLSKDDQSLKDVAAGQGSSKSSRKRKRKQEQKAAMLEGATKSKKPKKGLQSIDVIDSSRSRRKLVNQQFLSRQQSQQFPITQQTLFPITNLTNLPQQTPTASIDQQIYLLNLQKQALENYQNLLNGMNNGVNVSGQLVPQHQVKIMNPFMFGMNYPALPQLNVSPAFPQLIAPQAFPQQHNITAPRSWTEFLSTDTTQQLPSITDTFQNKLVERNHNSYQNTNVIRTIKRETVDLTGDGLDMPRTEGRIIQRTYEQEIRMENPFKKRNFL